MNKFNLLEFLPPKVLCGKNLTEYTILIDSIKGNNIALSYLTKLFNHTGVCGKRKYSLITQKNISRNNETFEVIGLLQAEMGKTNNGAIVFANSEYLIINKVMKWFEKELKLVYNFWQWYIKVNMNEPKQGKFRKNFENKIINYWLDKTKINSEKAHPKIVTYIKNTKNRRLRDGDYGTLIIERKINLLSQIVKRFVKLTTENMFNFEKEEIRCFMKGILAGESCVQIHKPSKHYSVHLSASEEKEREIYKKCLAKLGICLKCYDNYKETLISKKENIIQLHKQNLMCLSPKKYHKFLYMLTLYKEFP